MDELQHEKFHLLESNVMISSESQLMFLKNIKSPTIGPAACFMLVSCMVYSSTLKANNMLVQNIW